MTYLRLPTDGAEDYEIFGSTDGETVWNNSESQDPQYVFKLFEELREKLSHETDELVEEEDDDDVAPIQDLSSAPASSVRIPEPWTWMCYVMIVIRCY